MPLSLPRRPSVLVAAAVSMVAPFAMAQDPTAVQVIHDAIPGAPGWLPWVVAGATPVVTWIVYMLGDLAAYALSRALRETARAIRAKAAASPELTDDAPSAFKAGLLEGAADRLDHAASNIPRGPRGGQ